MARRTLPAGATTISRRVEVVAVKLTEENDEQVAAWLRAVHLCRKAEVSADGVSYGEFCEWWLNMGDWLVLEDDRFHVFSDNDIHERYPEVS